MEKTIKVEKYTEGLKLQLNDNKKIKQNKKC